MALNTLQVRRYPIHCTRFPTCSKFQFMTDQWVEKSAPNMTPQITLIHQRSKAPHICDSTRHYPPPRSQILVCFALQSTSFELQAILRQVHRMTLNCQRTYVPQIIERLHHRPKFSSICYTIIHSLDKCNFSFPTT